MRKWLMINIIMYNNYICQLYIILYMLFKDRVVDI